MPTGWLRRGRWAGRMLLGCVLLIGLLVAACGGGDDDDSGGNGGDNPVPVVANADEVYSAPATSEELAGFEDVVEEGHTAAYASDMSVDEVVAFYQNNLPEGWQLEMTVPSGDMTFVMLHKDDMAATIIIAPGTTLQESTIFNEEELSKFNFDEIGENQTGIVVASFTCKTLTGSECAQAILQ